MHKPNVWRKCYARSLVCLYTLACNIFYLQVSGEYAMLYHGAANGAFNLETTLMEVLTSMRRAGADVIISYFTPRVLEMIK